MLGTFLLLPLVIAGVLAVGAAMRALLVEATRLTQELERLGELRPALVELRDSAAVTGRRVRRT